ncbi:MAG: histidine kinase [Elusimicrobiaceae bacterium]|nr:histidine kinase [Elusimicrobiaceae bacterium]
MNANIKNKETPFKFKGYEHLMKKRIRRVLLVAVPYDSFLLTQDENITEIIAQEYMDLNLHYTPDITKASSVEEAQQLIKTQKFDVVITLSQVGEDDVGQFIVDLKKNYPDLFVVMMAFNMLEVMDFPQDKKELLDGMFLWNGDPTLFVTIIKILEDRINLDHDTDAGVQSILLVEDSMRFYSIYLPFLYSQVVKQTQILMSEGINFSQKVLRMRARPKIILATNYQEARQLYLKYKNNLLGVICDIQFPNNGKQDITAGIKLSKEFRKDNPDLPVLMQSSNQKWASIVHGEGFGFINKHSASLLEDVQSFISEYFAFGDFVFKLSDGTKVGKASNLLEMTKALKIVPSESLMYHAKNNHFSNWLLARTEFEIAYQIKPIQMSYFKDGKHLRKYLIELLHQFINKRHLGAIAEFDRKLFNISSPFTKIGSDSIGGKGRGLAFVNYLLDKQKLINKFEGVNIKVPSTVALGTDIFDFFIEQNHFKKIIKKETNNQKLAETFAKGKLPEYVRKNVKHIAKNIKGPIAVRSSSLLEDSRTQPFAGIYDTFMLINNHPDLNVKTENLLTAIKYVYASTYTNEAKSYLKHTTHIPEEEKMAVLIQEVVGKNYEKKRFYPTFSGLAQSYNYYPIPPMKPEEGIVYLAMGLGKTIMDGYKSLKFSPKHPQTLFQFADVKDYLNNSQSKFMGLDMTKVDDKVEFSQDTYIKTYSLDEAEKDNTLKDIASTYSHENDAIYDGIGRQGARLITFAQILKNNSFPLVEIIEYLMENFKKMLGSHVEIEFAVDLNPDKSGDIKFNILQVRPMISRHSMQKINLKLDKKEKLIGSSHMTLGNGNIKGIKDIIFVKPETFNSTKTHHIEAEIEKVNKKLIEKNKPSMMIGPGRWGSSDPLLGIPVKWNQISSAKVIVENCVENLNVEPSYGTHFYHNVSSLGIGYFMINKKNEQDFIDSDWINKQPADDYKYLKHIKLSKPLDIRIDGTSSKGVIAI